MSIIERILAAAGALALLAAPAAVAQEPYPGLPFAPSWAGRQPTGNADLDRAMAICDAHVLLPVVRKAPGLAPDLPVWYEPWARACAVWEDRWQATDEARQAREREVRDAADLRWLNQGAGVKQ